MKTRFLCENCGQSVPFNAEVCPACGERFRAVRCPICHMEGKPDLFSAGCPQCGYMSTQDVSGTKTLEPVSRTAARVKKPRRRKGVPWQVYAVAGPLLLFFLILMVILLR